MAEIDDSLKEGAKQLLQAIKTDDKKSFDAIIVNARYKNLSFGRFPLLSLMYFYNAKKLINVYEKDLLTVTEYTFVEEDGETYLLLKKFAGRSLRLYANSQKVVTPAETLAVLERDEKLKKICRNKNITPNEDAERFKSVPYIYQAAHGRTALYTEKGLKISRRHLTKRKLATVVSASFLAVVFVLVCAGFTGWAYSFGSGSEENPIKISSAEGLTKMLNSSDSCLLTNDVKLENVNLKEYSGNLDGSGRTLYIKNSTFPFIGTLNGKIKNLNIVFEDIDIIANESAALLSNVNDGTISGVKLSAECTFSVPQEDGEKKNESRYISFAATENNGNIENVTVDGHLTVNGTNTVNTFVSTVAGKNYGIIKNCSTSPNMSIVTDTADIGGIVSENLDGGEIYGCVNNASLTQSTAFGNWNPNVGGIALINGGSVIGCVNNGAVSASSTDSDTAVTESVNVGGIVCSNNKTVTRCKNYGKVYGIGATVYAYLGGIVSFNSEDSAVSGCGEDGTISAVCGAIGNNFCFAGGIVGYNGGYLLSNFANALISCSGANTVSGGIVGVSDNNTFAQTYYGRTAYYSSNYFVGSSALPYGIASYLYEFTNELGEINTGIALGGNLGTTLCESLGALKTAPVYWE